MTEINLNDILDTIKPNLVTPKLKEVTNASTTKKPRILSHLIIQGMVDGITSPITKEVIHDGKLHQIRFVNVDPLLTGPWAMISLMLLSLSYGEQSTIIESIYPERAQLAAKAFAVTFTHGLGPTNIQIEPDTTLVSKIDEANAGIALILTRMNVGTTIPHADEIEKERNSMAKLVQTMNERDAYQQATKRAEDANKFNDLTR